ncbi:MAG TPA: serine hydrolase domain-containing protein [Puia sp.]|nr:serine hydrolase domain-containing protein [Puia sp.]
MKKLLTVFLFSHFVFFSIVQAQKKPDLRDAFVVIDKWLNGMRDYDRLPGISIAIVYDQFTIWSKGYGYADVEKKVPMQPSTICSICSISKLFTSISVMQLVEQGKVRLDDSISADLPSFNLKQQYSESGPITIRSLLSHSSGLPREADFPYWSAPDFYFPSEKEVNDKLGGQQTLYPASTYFQYSNLGMTILGELVEHVSGMPYQQYVEENILNPLKLKNTHPYLPKDLWGGKMATGYGAIHRDGHRDKMPFFQANGITPAAGYSSSAEDLARFASWQFRLLSNGGKEIIKSSTLRDMQRVQYLDPDWKTAYGLGFAVREVNGNTFVGHGGSCPGYLSFLGMDPKKKLAVIVMMNAQGESLMKYFSGILSIMKKASQSDTTTVASGVDLQPYTGNYDSYAWDSETLVFKWYGKLGVMDLRTDNPVDAMQFYKHISGDVFRRIRSDESLGEEIRFERDANGKVIKLWHFNNFENRIPE